MDYEKEKCRKVEVDGVIASGNQYDIEIMIPEDNRDVIYGVLKDCYKKPICDAVVKLIEVEEKHCKKERKPVSHTFTDKDGEFVFGPLCPHKKYEIQFWADRVNHIKMCAKCTHEGDCLEGIKMDSCEHLFEKNCEKCYDKQYEKMYEEPYEKEYDKECEKKCEKPCDKEHDKECEKKCERPCDKEHDKECEKKCERPCCFKPCERPCCKCRENEKKY